LWLCWKKTEEIDIKDLIHGFLEKVSDILINCDLNNECIEGQIIELFNKYTQNEAEEIYYFLNSSECKNDCVEVFTEKFDISFSDLFCSNMCQ